MDPVLKNIIRIGTVVEYPPDPSKHLCRVMFEDKPATSSYWLPPLERFSLKNNTYWMPDIGEAVLCIFLPYGHSGQGFILGSYHRRDPSDSPVSTEDRRNTYYKKFEDGTSFEYNRKKNEMTINIQGTININILDAATINTADKIIVNALDNVTVESCKAISLVGQTVSIGIKEC